jgi:RNA polymerase sigma-70 factor, ECF subfamily
MYMLKNSMDAEDVTQEVLIRLWKNIDNFNINAAKSYIMKMTHNLCLDYLRRRKVYNNKEVEIDDYFEETYSNNDRTIEPEVMAGSKDLNTKIKCAVENLPDKLKSVFVMYQLQGMKYKEISEALDIPLNSVKVILMRARMKLQKELKQVKHEYSI